MNKNTLIVLLSVITVVSVGLYVNSKLETPIITGSSDSTNTNYYKTASHATVVCNGATSTLLLAAASEQGKRYSFEMTVASSTNITLCKKASGCTVGGGLTLNAGGGYFEQNDRYYGAYSCIGTGASSTVGLTYFQN